MTNIISPIEIVLKRDVAGKIPKGTKGRIVSIEVIKYSVHVEFENGMSYSDTYYGMTKEEMIETFEYKK